MNWVTTVTAIMGVRVRIIAETSYSFVNVVFWILVFDFVGVDVSMTFRFRMVVFLVGDMMLFMAVAIGNT